MTTHRSVRTDAYSDTREDARSDSRPRSSQPDVSFVLDPRTLTAPLLHAGRDRVEYPVPTLADSLAATDRVLDEVCDRLAEQWSSRSPDPVDVLPQDLPDRLRAWLLPATGKRLRPVMCYWGWSAAQGAIRGGHDDVVALCAALDLVHLFALVHDDVMDRSGSRRGRVTTHVEAARAHAEAGALGDPVLFGDSIAILFGDLALTEAWDLAAGLRPDVRRAWSDMLRELVQGQLLDLTGAAARRRDLDRARLVARLKSGAYTVQRPLRLGALVAGADASTLRALDAYGGHVGEAFALRDDVLGVWGDPGRTGKPVGDDLLSGKPTVLLAEARRLLPEQVAARHLGPDAVITPDDVPVLQRLMLEAGVLERTEHRISQEVELACEALDGAELDPRAAAELRAIADAVAWRDA
jgi:geranylgeranyl diphosphate synthase type I